MKPFIVLFLSFFLLGVYGHEDHFRTFGVDTWTATSAPKLNWASIASDATGQYLVVGAESGGSIYTSDDFGGTWNQSAALDPTLVIKALASDYSGKYLVAIQQDGDIYYSHNFGLNWTISNAGMRPWTDVASDSSGLHVIASAEGMGDSVSTIYISTDHGINWRDSGAPPAGSWVAVASDASGKNLVGVVYGRGIYTSGNYGQSWVSTSAPAEIYGTITCDSTGKYLVAVSNNGIFTSNSSGLIWYLTSAPAGLYIGVDSDSSGRYIDAVVYGGGVWSSDDYGASWVESNPLPQSWNGITVSQTGQRIVGITKTDGIFAYQDTSSFAPSVGPTARPSFAPSVFDPNATLSPTSTPLIPWTQSSVATHSWSSIASDLTGQYLVASEQTNGGLWTSVNYGTNWTMQFSIQNVIWNRVVSDATGVYLAAAVQSGGIYTSRDAGMTWKETTAEKNAWYGLASDYTGQYLAAVVLSNRIYTSYDYGDTWVMTDSPDAQWTDITSDSTGQYLAAVAKGNVIFTSADNGTTWVQMDSPLLSWIAIASDASGRYLVAAASSGGIYTSTDYGVSWYKTSAPLANWVSVCSDNTGAYLAAAVNNGGVWLSEDFGSTWVLSAAPSDYWAGVASDQGGKRLAAVGSNPLGIWTYFDPTTFKPSSMPTIAPTRPTAHPTVNPSAGPSVSPSERPSVTPSVSPSVEPSITPSAFPTNPTVQPTINPSVDPSQMPSLAPSVGPTVIITLAPTTMATSAPSALPTAPVSITVEFTSNITLNGATSAVLDTASQDVVRSTTATAMGLSISSVEYVGATVIFQSGSRPASDALVASLLKDHNQYLRVQPAAVVYVLSAVVRTKASLSGTSFVDPVAMYNSLVSLLDSSVASGSFTSQMRSQAASSGSTQLAATSATGVNSSPMVVVTSPLVDDGNGGSSTLGMIAGLVVGLVMGAMIVGCIFYWRCYRHQSKEPLSASATQEEEANDNTLLAPEEKKSKKGFKNFKNALFRKKKPSTSTSGSNKSDVKASSVHGSRHGFQALGASNDFFEFDVNPASPDRNNNNKEESNDVYEYEMNPVRTVPDFYKNAARAAPVKKLSNDSIEFGLNPEGNKKGSSDFYENPTRSVPNKM
eukprot:gene18957-21566_t